MARLNTLLFLVVVALAVVALIDCLLTERSRLQSFPRGAWTVLILLCPVFGPVAWFRAGRAAPTGAPAPLGAPAGASAPATLGPKGPDDDPEFLDRLAEAIRNR
ncbi:PLD nuclease N-terminal domain-containing protein [Actinoplanes xinjiangensis]|uniref:PLD nuclease N-terminal domain-containing protein n=1 Tax=Actinoplanes xinjiangensis TaxID=512350 RepID=UPI003413981D